MSPNKKKVAIVIDGGCSLTPAQALEFGFHVIPVYVNFTDKTYVVGVDLQTEQFYPMLKNSKQLPSSSQPTVRDYALIYQKLAAEADEIISITISRAMSAGIDNAISAIDQVPGTPVHVIDSQSVSMGMGLMAIAAARKAAEGWGAKEIIAFIEELKVKMNAIFTVDTLEFLRKGGRIGGAAALLASALDIKPILTVKAGRIEALEKQRTRKRVIARMLDIMEERLGKSPATIAILHCNVAAESAELAEQIKTRFNLARDVIWMDAGPDIATHAGPGTIGLVFYAE